MSNDRQRVKRAIQRIAEQSPGIRSLLDAADNKGGKPGAAGAGGGQGEGQEDQICCNGSVGDPNPGADERDPGNDQDGLNPDDPAKLDLDGACLSGVTECTTGDPICFCGDDFIPPDDWDDPQDPPVDSTYVEGKYYETPDDIKGITYSELESKYNSTFTGTYKVIPCDECTTGIVQCQGTPQASVQNIEITSSVHCVANVGQSDCSTNHDPVCDQPVPHEDAWPSDGCINLAIVNGTIVGSKYDPENDGSYSAPRDEIHLCDGANDMYLKPSADGGWKSINSTKTEGYLYNSKFEQIAHIDGNEYSDPNV